DADPGMPVRDDRVRRVVRAAPGGSMKARPPLLGLLLVGATAVCGGSSGGSPSPSGAPSTAPSSGSTGFFPPAAVWSSDVSEAPRDRESGAVIAFLDRVGWGLGRMQIDFSIEVLEAAADTPLLAFQPTEDHFLPDCDLDPVPVPPGGALEGESG